MRVSGTEPGPGRPSRLGVRLLAVVDRAYHLVLSAICVGLFLAMLGAIGLQVVMRYVFDSPLVWSEELARFCMIWLAFVAAALAMRHGQHIRVSGLIDVPPGGQRLLSGVLTTITLLVLGVVLWQGWAITLKTANQTSTALQLPMSVVYAAIPVSISLMIVGIGLSVWCPDDHSGDPGPTTLGDQA